MADGPSVAVIGLGIMGSRMARQLALHGFHVRGFDPDTDRLAGISVFGGEQTGSPSEAVSGSWAALLALPNSDVSRQVCLGDDGIAASGMSGLLVYDATTGRPGDSVEIAESLDQVGITYCDTTVSGNGEIAERGDLVVMVGGALDAYKQGTPIFEAIGRSHHHLGPVGSGATMKLLVNQTLTIHRMALAETLVVAEMARLDLDATVAVLRDSLAYSKAMDVWGDRMITGDHQPPFSRLRQSSKDARLIVEQALALGAPADLVEVVAAALTEGEANGLGDLDNSAIVEVVRRRAGIGRVP
jgi:3-hydroxyisobutyrate dehydrogenase-like beta-hydroxyacid dehydrogenase